MPQIVPVHDGIRRADIRAIRELTWRNRTEDSLYSRMGDVLAYRRYPENSDLWRYGYRKADWWIKPRLDGVRFRPDLTAQQDLSREEGGVYEYDYCNGTITLFYGSSYGVPARQRSFRLEGTRHYLETISQ